MELGVSTRNLIARRLHSDLSCHFTECGSAGPPASAHACNPEPATHSRHWPHLHAAGAAQARVRDVSVPANLVACVHLGMYRGVQRNPNLSF